MSTMEESQIKGDAMQMIENSLSSVKIIKNTKGYNWEIKCKHEDVFKALAATQEIDKELRQIYGNNTN